MRKTSVIAATLVCVLVFCGPAAAGADKDGTPPISVEMFASNDKVIPISAAFR